MANLIRSAYYCYLIINSTDQYMSFSYWSEFQQCLASQMVAELFIVYLYVFYIWILFYLADELNNYILWIVAGYVMICLEFWVQTTSVYFAMQHWILGMYGTLCIHINEAFKPCSTKKKKELNIVFYAVLTLSLHLYVCQPIIRSTGLDPTKTSLNACMVVAPDSPLHCTLEMISQGYINYTTLLLIFVLPSKFFKKKSHEIYYLFYHLSHHLFVSNVAIRYKIYFFIPNYSQPNEYLKLNTNAQICFSIWLFFFIPSF